MVVYCDDGRFYCWGICIDSAVKGHFHGKSVMKKKSNFRKVIERVKKIYKF